MIGKIKGKISEIHESEALIETKGGVFYRVYITPDILGTNPKEEIEVYTYLNVREDELTLYGFKTYQMYKMFTLFIGVDGVGPKVAYGIISSSDPSEIREAVASSDVAYFKKIKGVGKKTAQKILVDLSSKFGSEFDVSTLQESPEDKDAIDALASLGFKKEEARKALQEIDTNFSLQDKITAALRNLSHK